MSDIDFDPFQGGELAAVVMPTAPQREVWMASQLGDEVNLAFNESVTVRLRGPLEVDVLDAALQALVTRHESLRSTISLDGQLVIAATGTWPVVLHREATEDTLAAVIATAVSTPFALDRGPLVRAELVELGPTDHALVLTAHHVVCDGWSTGVLLRELGQLYTAGAGRASTSLPPAASWAAYADGRAAHDDTDDVAWWLDTLRRAGPPEPLDLPTDRPRPALRTYRSERYDVVLDLAVVEAVERAAKALDVTPFAALLAGFSGLLARLAPPDEDVSSVVIGVPSAGQALEGRAGRYLVGHAVNLLPIPLTVGPGDTFATLAVRARDQLYASFDHATVTYGRLLEELALARDPSRPPLLAIQFNLDQSLDPATLGFVGLTAEVSTNPRHYENFELFINASRAPDGLHVECQFNADLFDRDTIAGHLQAYQVWLAAAAAAPSALVRTLPLLDAAQTEALVALGTGPTLAAGGTVCALVQSAANRSPARPAVRDASGVWTYAELETRVSSIARSLGARGVGHGDIVGLAVARGRDMVAAALAIQTVGAAYLPLDVDYPRDRVAYMIAHSKAVLVLADVSTVERVPEGVPVLTLDALMRPTAPVGPSRTAPPSASDLAYVIYTSGSTGKPKGVELSHGAVSAFLRGLEGRLALTWQTRLVAVTTLSFDIAVLELFAPLLVGGQVVIASREVASDGAALVAFIQDAGANALQATPATWRLLLEAGWKGAPGFLALVGGEAFPNDLVAPLRERTGALWNMYGPTETTVWSTSYRLDAAPSGAVPIGVPLPGERAWVVDALGQLCPVGVPGELMLGGLGVARGYRFDPEQTAARFVPAPLDGGRAYRTGDRARWARRGGSTVLVFERRLDTQVKVRGFRIELGEIESVLATHPAVVQAVVSVYEPRPGDARLAAYLVIRGQAPTVAAIREHVQGSLPPYMVPQHVVFVPQLPLTPNGKVDRKALPKPDADVARETVAPRTDSERAVARIVSEVLGLRRVSMTDDFFELGGHSILATRVVAKIRDELNVSLPLRRLFDTPVLSALAGHVDGMLALERAKSTRSSTLVDATQSASAPAADANETEELEF